MCWLKCWDDTIENQHDGTNESKPWAFTLSQPEPHEITTTYLAQTGQYKVEERLCYYHLLSGSEFRFNIFVEFEATNSSYRINNSRHYNSILSVLPQNVGVPVKSEKV
jgi:hypothetical protein